MRGGKRRSWHCEMQSEAASSADLGCSSKDSTERSIRSFGWLHKSQLELPMYVEGWSGEGLRVNGTRTRASRVKKKSKPSVRSSCEGTDGRLLSTWSVVLQGSLGEREV